jgi:hypothetical protein
VTHAARVSVPLALHRYLFNSSSILRSSAENNLYDANLRTDQLSHALDVVSLLLRFQAIA